MRRNMFGLLIPSFKHLLDLDSVAPGSAFSIVLLLSGG
ncbi:hypothetical protein Q31a_17450 [Aureliella helgolandensis]|uniref:Uncharacterized protein n=1 Tax=Aureliella helgolandensis TaxID=2527968 RepID=A0A518G4C2_9BACT|nr:hypothetical protein Q31a_17450 [Aureliella helgolandensis]